MPPSLPWKFAEPPAEPTALEKAIAFYYANCEAPVVLRVYARTGLPLAKYYLWILNPSCRCNAPDCLLSFTAGSSSRRHWRSGVSTCIGGVILYGWIF